MAALSRLPLFLSLRGRPCLVAGGSAAAAWKAELLMAAGAEVVVASADPSPEMRQLAEAPPPSEQHGTTLLLHRAWQREDLKAKALAVGAFGSDAEAECFAAAAAAAGVPVNLVERQADSAVTFGSIVNRSPLVVAVGSDGTSPLFGQTVRARIEALLPQGLAGWAAAAQSWRCRLRGLLPERPARRRFWQALVEEALQAPAGHAAPGTLERLAEDARTGSTGGGRGRITLVGAGPGDPELLTLRALRALQSAEVVLYDELVHSAILDLARREARRIRVGKRGHGPSTAQNEINELLLALAREGRQVVRLKGGDPMIFGRAGEELTAARAAGIPIEIVPGITAAQGAAARLGVTLTHRDHAQRLQYVTAHAKGGKLPSDIDWSALADPAVTTCVYMPKHTLSELVATALTRGLDPQTPAVAMANATRSDESLVAAPLVDLPGRLAGAMPEGPMLVLIGWVLAELLEGMEASVAAKG